MLNLFDPPYWDTILGAFREAIWLVDNGWDYHKLFFEEPGYSAGGSRIYVISIYPILISILFAIFDEPKSIFIILHIINYCFTIATLYLFIKIILSLKTHLSTTTKVLCLMSLAGSPLFLSQACAINMEMPICFFTLLSIHYYSNGRYLNMILACYLGFAFKASISPLAMVLAFLSLVTIRHPKKPFIMLSLLIMPFIYIGFLKIDRSFFYQAGSDSMFSVSLFSLEKIYSLVSDLYIEFPKIFVISLIICLFTSLLFILNKFKQNIFLKISNYEQRLAICLSLYILVFSFVITCCSNAPARYWLPSIPIVFLLIILIHNQTAKISLSNILLPIFFLVSIANNLWFSYNQVSDYKLNIRTSEKTSKDWIIETSIARQLKIEDDLLLIEKFLINKPKNIITVRPYSLILKDKRYGYIPAWHKTENTNVYDVYYDRKEIEEKLLSQNREFSILNPNSAWSVYLDPYIKINNNKSATNN